MSPSVGELVTVPAQPLADSDKGQHLKVKDELSGSQNACNSTSSPLY